MRNLLLFLFLVLGNVFVSAQMFPEIWDYSSYDLSRGKKGQLYIINYDGQSTPFENEAFIFATSLLESGFVYDKDLFRLTCRGVSTLNSPFNGYNVTLDFCNKGTFQGGISGSHSVLRMYGKENLSLGVQHNEDILSLTNDWSTFSNDVKVDHSGIALRFGLNNAKKCGWIGSATNDGVEFGTNSETAFYIKDRNAYLGFNEEETSNISEDLKKQYNVFVKKGVLSVDYAIAPIASWADFVFDKDFHLRSVQELEHYINSHGHLPDVPSAKEVAVDGYSQHDINKALLQKIEELTLYIIEQQKEIDKLKKLVNKE